jgi:hypothetical protein
MLRFFRTLLVTGILHGAIVICASAQTPPGTPNTPPSGQRPEGSAASSAGSTTSGIGADTSGTNPPAGASTGTRSTTNAPTTTGKSSDSTGGKPEHPPTSAAPGADAEEAQPNPVNNPPTPTTTILPGAKAGEKDPTDVGELLAPGPLPKEKLSLIGGTVRKIDPVREKMTVKIHGADSIKIAFDQRTHFFRDGREVTQTAIKPGDRVYIDTQLDQNQHVFAKSVRVQTSSNPADATGQVLSYNRKSGEMIVQDNLSSRPVRFRMTSSTEIMTEGTDRPQPLAGKQLKEGSLVSVKFLPAQQGGIVAEQVRILAETGSSFTFFGRITHVDLRNGKLAIENDSDGKTYEISLNPVRNRLSDDVTVGARATIVATFRGQDYQAQSITVSPNQQVQSESEKQ